MRSFTLFRAAGTRLVHRSCKVPEGGEVFSSIELGIVDVVDFPQVFADSL